MGWWGKKAEPEKAAQAEPDSLEEQSEPIASNRCQSVSNASNRRRPLVLGSMKSAQEHALKIVEVIRETGSTNRAIYQGELEDMHASMCADLGWHHRAWHSVGRELVRLPGVVRDEVRIDGARLTFYEVRPAEESAKIVPLPACRVG